MIRPYRLLALAALAALTAGAQAQTTTGAAQTLGNISFSLTTTVSGFTACNELRVDATGDFTNSTKFMLYGVLNCPSTATGYTLAGSGYIGFDNSINMGFFMGNGLALQCPRLVDLAGTCSFYNASGVQVGTATLAPK